MSKLYRYFLYALIGGLVFSACRKDNIEPNTEIINPPIEMGEESGISGVVIDVEGRALQNVEIKLLTSFGEEVIQTSDENGYFRFDNVAFDTDGGLLSFSHIDYFDNYKFAYPARGQRAWAKVRMIPRSKAGDFDSAVGKTFKLGSSAQIQFDAGVISTANGSNYNGNVNVYAHWYNPASDNFLQTSPGDLRGIDALGGTVQLQSYGMMAVELEDDSGNELQIKGGETVQLIFPVSGDAPNEIPLWYFDEANGDWIEEGIANLEGGKYVANVPHFSFWNCDIPFDFINLKGRLVSDDGTPFSNQEIVIRSDNFGYANSFSNSEGYFEGKVPRDEPLVLQVIASNDCPSGDNILFEQEYNFSEDTDLGEIILSSPIIDENVYHFITALKDCLGDPVPNAFLLVDVNSKVFILESDEQGVVSGFIDVCDETTATVYAIDQSNGLRSQEVSIDLNTPTIVLADIRICDESEFYFEISVDGSDRIRIPDPAVYDFKEDKYFIYAEGNESLSAIIIDLSTSPPVVTSSSFEVFDLEQISHCFLPASPCDDLDVNITYDATSNTLFGSISGGLQTGTSPSDNRNIEISFFLPFMEERLTTAIVPVHIWFDENEDGIRDPNEPFPTSTAEFSGAFFDSFTGESRFQTNIFQKTFNLEDSFNPTNGTVEIELLENDWWHMEHFGQLAVTLQNQGADELLDSDFDPISMGSGLHAADDFFVEKGVPFTGLGIGLIKPPELFCSSILRKCAPDGMIEVVGSGGTPPYSYTWPEPIGGFGPVLGALEGGIYDITIQDAAGATCIQSIDLADFNNQLSGFIFVDEAGGTDNIYDPGIDTKLEGVSIVLAHPVIFIPPIISDSEGNFNVPVTDGLFNTFTLRMEPLSGFTPLVPNVGNDESIDSDLGDDFCGEWCIPLEFAGCNDQLEFAIGLKRQ